jgi:hypothetical protein
VVGREWEGPAPIQPIGAAGVRAAAARAGTPKWWTTPPGNDQHVPPPIISAIRRLHLMRSPSLRYRCVGPRVRPSKLSHAGKSFGAEVPRPRAFRKSRALFSSPSGVTGRSRSMSSRSGANTDHRFRPWVNDPAGDQLLDLVQLALTPDGHFDDRLRSLRIEIAELSVEPELLPPGEQDPVRP